VEVVAMLPLMAGVALLVLQLLAAGTARELAGHAAEAGAVAILQGRDPRAAAREAVPGWSAAALRVTVRGRTVRVRLRPRALTQELGERLTSEAVASAGRSS
jgi:hypothetical protein